MSNFNYNIMTQENKELLIKDLCARLPYGVWIERKLKSCKFGAKCMLHAHDIDAIERGQYDFYKPYLFPLSSMIEEQKREFDISMDMGYAAAYNAEINCANRMIDFFNKYHLDYRGLIPMGLAIDATGLNIY